MTIDSLWEITHYDKWLTYDKWLKMTNDLTLQRTQNAKCQNDKLLNIRNYSKLQMAWNHMWLKMTKESECTVNNDSKLQINQNNTGLKIKKI